MNHQAQALRITATSSRLTATMPWNPEALVKTGLLLFAAGILLQAFQAPR